MVVFVGCDRDGARHGLYSLSCDHVLIVLLENQDDLCIPAVLVVLQWSRMSTRVESEVGNSLKTSEISPKLSTIAIGCHLLSKSTNFGTLRINRK